MNHTRRVVFFRPEQKDEFSSLESDPYGYAPKASPSLPPAARAP